MDQEFIRIAGILKLLEEAEDRLWKMRRQLGSEAFERAVRYLADRKKYFFSKFNAV